MTKRYPRRCNSSIRGKYLTIFLALAFSKAVQRFSNGTVTSQTILLEGSCLITRSGHSASNLSPMSSIRWWSGLSRTTSGGGWLSRGGAGQCCVSAILRRNGYRRTHEISDTSALVIISTSPLLRERTSSRALWIKRSLTRLCDDISKTLPWSGI